MNILLGLWSQSKPLPLCLPKTTEQQFNFPSTKKKPKTNNPKPELPQNTRLINPWNITEAFRADDE